MEKCEKCEVKPATGKHSCPYASEICNEHRADYCNCCSDCEYECCMDI